MALEINITSQVTVNEPVLKPTDIVHVKGVYFDFDNTEATVLVQYGQVTDGNFVPMVKETWTVSGNYYGGIVLSAPIGQTMGEVLLTKVAQKVGEVQLTPGLKDSLIN